MKNETYNRYRSTMDHYRLIQTIMPTNWTIRRHGTIPRNIQSLNTESGRNKKSE